MSSKQKKPGVVLEMETGRATFEALPLTAGPKIRKFPFVPEDMMSRARELETEKRANSAAGRKDPEGLRELTDLWASIRAIQSSEARRRREFELAKQAKARAKEAARPGYVA